MDVYWFERNAADVPTSEAWLTSAEINYLRALRFPKRRADWLLGRWTAKNAVACLLGIPRNPGVLRQIEILPTPSGAPEVLWCASPADVAISLSHRAGIGACALASAGVRLGCDLEIIEPHGDAFPGDYFTPEEQALLNEAPTPEYTLQRLNLLWSAKESALKAMGEGLRIDTRRVAVSVQNVSRIENDTVARSACSSSDMRKGLLRPDWYPLQIHYTGGEVFHGWWNQTGELLRTVIAIPALRPPLFMDWSCEEATAPAGNPET